MEKVLVTDAAGNEGAEVVKTLELTNMQTLSAVLRQEDIKKFSSNKAVVFDFENSNTWEPALKGVDRVFLMRPSAIADVKTYLFPFIDLLLQEGIKDRGPLVVTSSHLLDLIFSKPPLTLTYRAGLLILNGCNLQF